jgi:hypothetical protein
MNQFAEQSELLLVLQEQVFFFHDQQLIAVNLDGLAAVLARTTRLRPFTPTEHFTCRFLTWATARISP